MKTCGRLQAAFNLLIALLFAAVLKSAAATPASKTEELETAGAATGKAPGKLTIGDAVQRALASNFTIQVSRVNVPIAGAAVSEAYGAFDPHLSFSYTGSHDEQPRRLDTQTGQHLPPTIDQSSGYTLALKGELPLGLSYQVGGTTSNDRGTFNGFAGNSTSFAGASLTVPLLRGFGSAASYTSIRIARTNRRSSEWDLRATVINTITKVIYAYDELLFAHADLRAAQRSRDLANQLYQENQHRHNVGAMSEYDVLSAKARVATREESIIVAEREVHEAENHLKELMSDNTSPALLRQPVDLAAVPPPRKVSVDVDTDIPWALEHRPDFQQAKLALERNKLNCRLYRNQLLPSVDLVGSYGYNGVGDSFSASRNEVSGRGYPAYSAGIKFSIPITSTAERARYHSARLKRQQAELSLSQLRQEIVVDVGNAAGRIHSTWKRVQATRASRELSEKTLADEVKRLRAGAGSTFVVLQLQEIVSSNEVHEARALADYRNARAEYDRQLGRTLQRFHIEFAANP